MSRRKRKQKVGEERRGERERSSWTEWGCREAEIEIDVRSAGKGDGAAGGRTRNTGVACRRQEASKEILSCSLAGYPDNSPLFPRSAWM